MKANSEQKTRAAQQFVGWLRRFHPEMHAAIVSRAGEARKAGALNQLGEAWDMFYPSMYYDAHDWTSRYHSDRQHLSGLGQDFSDFGISTTTTTSESGSSGGEWYEKIFKFAEKAVPAYLAYDAQKDIMKLNLDRAKQGLPPIDPGMTAPQVRVVHDFPPVVQQEIKSWKESAMKIGIWAAVGLVAFFVVRKVL